MFRCPSDEIIFKFYVPAYKKGTIPQCIWNMSTLTTLHMASNGFQGTIPDYAFNKLDKLTNVNLARNHLWGDISTLYLRNYTEYGNIHCLLKIIIIIIIIIFFLIKV